MTLDELLQEGWSAHDARTEEVAASLEDGVGLVHDDDGAAKFMNLAIHCMGDHGGDRSRARRACEAVLEQLGDAAGTGAWGYLAVARHLDGDAEAAVNAEKRAGVADDPGVGVRIRLLVAQGRMHAGEWDAASELYRAAVAESTALPEGHAGERASAIVSNNIASELLALEGRTGDQTQLMSDAAETSREFWSRIGTWVNDERADYLLSLVRTSAGDPTAGREHAERGLATIDAAVGDGQVDEAVDRAFLHLAQAAACRDLGRADAQAEALAKADALAAAFDSDGLKSWFAAERAKAT